MLSYKKISETKASGITIYSLPNNKIWSKFKAFADNNLNVYQKLKFALGRLENIVGKGQNAGYQHFLLPHKVFKRLQFLRVTKSWDCVEMS